jgi:hypothetical protein
VIVRLPRHPRSPLLVPRLETFPVKAQGLTGRKVGLVLKLSVGDRLIAGVTGAPVAVADPHLARWIAWDRQAAGRDLCSDASGHIRSHRAIPLAAFYRPDQSLSTVGFPIYWGCREIAPAHPV